jgi:N-acetylmuramoyl-L-alanine amidase
MKSVLVLWLALAPATGLAGVAAAPRAPESLQLAGAEYLRLPDWATTNGFNVRWLKRDELLQLTNRSARLLLTVDANEARVNGVAVWLLYPIAARFGTVYLARQDAEATLRPLLFPARSTRPATPIQTVCLDPGHGGKDPGFCVGTKAEKRYTLLLAQEVRQQLTRAGLKATLTRTTDTTLDLPTRPELAKQRKADLFLSLHFNAFPAAPASVRGTEVYCLPPAGAPSTIGRNESGGAGPSPGNLLNDQNLLLAYQVQKSLTHILETEDRGVRRARFVVLRNAAMPAILIEAGFLSHPKEGRKILDAGYRRQIAHAIVEGLLAYKRLTEPPEPAKTAAR